MAQNLPAKQEMGGFDLWVGKIPWRRKWQPTPVFLPRESQGRRSLGGFCLWGPRESDMTEATQQQLVFLPGKSHGQRSLAGFSPGGHKESDTT